MTYENLNKVINSTTFQNLTTIAFNKAATQIKAEATTGNVVTDSLRQTLANKILAGGSIQRSWLTAVANNITPDSVITPFTTTPEGAIDAGFDAAVNTAISGVFNHLSGVTSNQ